MNLWNEVNIVHGKFFFKVLESRALVYLNIIY